MRLKPMVYTSFDTASSSDESNRRTSHQSRHTRRSDFGSRRSLSTRVFDGWLRNRFAKAAALVFSQRHDRTSSQSTFGESLSKDSVTQRLATARPHTGAGGAGRGLA